MISVFAKLLMITIVSRFDWGCCGLSVVGQDSGPRRLSVSDDSQCLSCFKLNLQAGTVCWSGWSGIDTRLEMWAEQPSPLDYNYQPASNYFLLHRQHRHTNNIHLQIYRAAHIRNITRFVTVIFLYYYSGISGEI